MERGVEIMEEKEIKTDQPVEEKKNHIWKKFFKEQLFFLIFGTLMAITYFIVFALKKDFVYLYLGLAALGVLVFFIGLEALFLVLKNRKNKEEKEC